MTATEPRGWRPLVRGPDPQQDGLIGVRAPAGALAAWMAAWMDAGAGRAAGRGTARGTAEETTGRAAEPGQVIVLVAEDDEVIAETLAQIVEDEGHVAVVARDGRRALDLARQHRPRLIITDLMMPYLDGANLIAAVRRDAAGRGAAAPPVIVVTALGRARAEAAGADVVITKPFDLARLEAAMRGLLGAEEV